MSPYVSIELSLDVSAGMGSESTPSDSDSDVDPMTHFNTLPGLASITLLAQPQLEIFAMIFRLSHHIK